jgi:hypothetical protein
MFRVFGDGLVISVQISERKAPATVDLGVFRIYVAGFLVLLDGRLILSLSGKYKPPTMIIAFDLVWLSRDGFLELLDRFGIFFLFGERPAPALVDLGVCLIYVAYCSMAAS